MTQTIAGLTPVIVFSSQYNANGRRTQLSAEIGASDDFVNDYTYDNLNRLTRLTQDDQAGYAVAEKRVDFTYDAASRYSTITRYKDTDGGAANLVMTGTYTIDALGRLTSLVYADSTPSTIRSFAWTYDAAGRMVSHDSDIASEDVSEYTHDATDQLTDADYTTGSDESYTYDENGNRVTANGDSYETDTNNRLVSDDYYRYQYDAEGNLVYRYVDADSSETLNTGDTDITEYDWDHRNRMTDVAHKAVFGGSVDWTTEYVYDAFNRRIGALYDTDGDSALDLEERYVWNGKNVVLDFIDSDGDGGAASLELTNRYLWGQAVDQLLAQETYDDGGAEDVLWPVTDNLGSVRSLVEYDGDIVATYSFDTFGNVTVLVGNITDTRYLFTCQEYDLATGFYYYDARWYDPAIGKFIGLDPISFFAGDANLYRYVGNNPLNWIDPTGEAWYEFDAFGESWTLNPFADNAGGVGDTLSAYGSAAETAATGTIYGAAGGAATGTAAGMATGAVIGGVATGGPGALPGAGIGAGAGLVAGTTVGGVSGFLNAMNAKPGTSNEIIAGQSAEEGMILGVPSGIMGGAGAALTTPRLPAKPSTPKPATQSKCPGATAKPSAPSRPSNLSSQSASRPGSDYSEAGSSLQSHSPRPGWPGPKPSGNASAVNAQGQALVDDILANPGSRFTTRPHPRPEWGGSVTDVYRPDGLGARFDANGQFIGFITR